MIPDPVACCSLLNDRDGGGEGILSAGLPASGSISISPIDPQGFFAGVPCTGDTARGLRVRCSHGTCAEFLVK